MIVGIVFFAVYVIAGAAFAVYGARTARIRRYAVAEGVASAVGVIVAAVSYFSFGRLPGHVVPDAEMLSVSKEAFSVFALVALIVSASVILLSGLSVALNLAEKKKPGAYVRGLWYAAPAIGTVSVFTMAIFALRFTDGLAAPAYGEITAFALGAALALRVVLMAAALIRSRSEDVL